MANKQSLRVQRAGTIINMTSKEQEKALAKVLKEVCIHLVGKFKYLSLVHEKSWFLRDVVKKLKTEYPDVDFFFHHDSSGMRPDGGILSIIGHSGRRYPILIAEKKNQGTNDLRTSEGKKKQAKGNAIERLGKNVIGLRTALMSEAIFPFVCFGDGCDFTPDSSILDRVVTIGMFGKLNAEHLHNQGAGGVFNRGSFYFRPEQWTVTEMLEVCTSIAEKSVYYYLSKYGETEVYATRTQASKADVMEDSKAPAVD